MSLKSSASKGSCKQIVCNTEVRANGKKYILVREPQEDCEFAHDTFDLIGRDSKTGDFVVLVPEGYVGWVIDDPKISRVRGALVFKGKKFWDVPKQYVVSEVK